MIDYISISTLNDFIFCPYSIYLHNVYMETDEGNYHALPQTLGKIAHESVDRKTSTTRSDVILSLPVFSEEYGLMGIEGFAAKTYFKAYFCDLKWKQRQPRTKCDPVNVTLDIGYTMLFNFVECFLRMFGFDLYVGIYHRMWCRRKSLVCDLMEPLRPVIDKTVRTAWNKRQFSEKDFVIQKGEYRLRHDRNGDYCQIFFNALIPYKTDVFRYIQSYYRCFMNKKPIEMYPRIIL